MKIKPCPFCGGKKINIFPYDPYDGYQGNLTVHKIVCTTCGATITKQRIEDVIEAWNQRTHTEVRIDGSAIVAAVEGAPMTSKEFKQKGRVFTV